MVRVIVIAIALVMQAGCIRPHPEISIYDDFESSKIREDIWSDHVYLPGRAGIDEQYNRSGQRSLRITALPGDDPLKLKDTRAEIIEDRAIMLPYGQEVWYGFSMNIPATIIPDGNRLVIGQLHQDVKGSPIVGQRFNNGFFEITLQDEDCRVRLVTQKGNRPTTVCPKGVSSKKKMEDKNCSANIKVERYGYLPSPSDGWIDLIYHVRPAKRGQEGIVEVWANGQKLAKATGSIGYKGAKRQYFKFGPYTNQRSSCGVNSSPITAYMDEFRRGASFEEVAGPR